MTEPENDPGRKSPVDGDEEKPEPAEGDEEETSEVEKFEVPDDAAELPEESPSAVEDAEAGEDNQTEDPAPENEPEVTEGGDMEEPELPRRSKSADDLTTLKENDLNIPAGGVMPIDKAGQHEKHLKKRKSHGAGAKGNLPHIPRRIKNRKGVKPGNFEKALNDLSSDFTQSLSYSMSQSNSSTEANTRPRSKSMGELADQRKVDYIRKQLLPKGNIYERTHGKYTKGNSTDPSKAMSPADMSELMREKNAFMRYLERMKKGKAWDELTDSEKEEVKKSYHRDRKRAFDRLTRPLPRLQAVQKHGEAEGKQSEPSSKKNSHASLVPRVANLAQKPAKETENSGSDQPDRPSTPQKRKAAPLVPRVANLAPQKQLNLEPNIEAHIEPNIAAEIKPRKKSQGNLVPRVANLQNHPQKAAESFELKKPTQNNKPMNVGSMAAKPRPPKNLPFLMNPEEAERRVQQKLKKMADQQSEGVGQSAKFRVRPLLPKMEVRVLNDQALDQVPEEELGSLLTSVRASPVEERTKQWVAMADGNSRIITPKPWQQSEDEPDAAGDADETGASDQAKPDDEEDKKSVKSSSSSASSEDKEHGEKKAKSSRSSSASSRKSKKEDEEGSENPENFEQERKSPYDEALNKNTNLDIHLEDDKEETKELGHRSKSAKSVASGRAGSRPQSVVAQVDPTGSGTYSVTSFMPGLDSIQHEQQAADNDSDYGSTARGESASRSHSALSKISELPLDDKAAIAAEEGRADAAALLMSE